MKVEIKNLIYISKKLVPAIAAYALMYIMGSILLVISIDSNGMYKDQFFSNGTNSLIIQFFIIIISVIFAVFIDIVINKVKQKDLKASTAYFIVTILVLMLINQLVLAIRISSEYQIIGINNEEPVFGYLPIWQTFFQGISEPFFLGSLVTVLVTYLASISLYLFVSKKYKK